jgi:flagellar secretion chaperone FliS
MPKNPYQKYRESAVQSASREKILLMLYEGAIRFTKLAHIACLKKDIAERGLNIGRAYDIIMELNNTLNHEVGGEISSNLEQLYMFMTERLTKANVTGDGSHLEQVIKLLETLYSGWVEAIEKLKREESAKP